MLGTVFDFTESLELGWRKVAAGTVILASLTEVNVPVVYVESVSGVR